jgi:histidine triad (HIT) family protein
MPDESCLFCRIIAGEIRSEKVAKTDRALAFRDIDPQAPVHVLVIPRTHVPTLTELAESDPDDAVAVLTLARQVAAQEGVADGYRLVANNGAPAQQSVFHAHVHVLGGRPFTWPPG